MLSVPPLPAVPAGRGARHGDGAAGGGDRFCQAGLTQLGQSGEVGEGAGVILLSQRACYIVTYEQVHGHVLWGTHETH